VTSEPPDVAAELAAMAPLADPTRRALYLYVADQAGEVSREQAASATGTARAMAAFHLDKLVDAGLLEVSFRRLTGRTGPGAGRPAKLYRQADTNLEVSLPPRHYGLAAELLAQAAGTAAGVQPALVEAADRAGRHIGRDARRRLGRRTGRSRTIVALRDALAARGYKPYELGGDLRLANCPFAALAETHRELICGMNLALIGGALAGMAADDLVACPQPTPGECCVAVRSRAAGPGSHPAGAPGASGEE
jgi:predicted ArsR family transcriptional regulator